MTISPPATPSSSSSYPELTFEEFSKAIGDTPLVKIQSISEEIGRDIYVKTEWLNPGKSIKDRPVVYLMQDALKSGRITPGGTFVEATAGNTGIALAILAKTYDPPFKVRLYVAETLIQQKIDNLEGLGATVVKCPLVPNDDPMSTESQAARYAKENENCCYVDQMNNLSNSNAHYDTTGPEIWRQTNGKVDAFICGAGTGGTLNGVATYLKEQSGGKVKAYLSDRPGSGLHSYVQSKGETFKVPDDDGASLVEGIGRMTLTQQISDLLTLVDGAVKVKDLDTVLTIYNLIEKENLYVGASGALNITAAKEVAKTLPAGSVIVTTVADSSQVYAAKIFNKKYLEANGIWDKIPEHLRKYATFVEN